MAVDAGRVALVPARVRADSCLDEKRPARRGRLPVQAPGRYAIVESPLGRLMVAASAQGVAMIEFDDSVRVLHGRVKERFPHARLCPSSADFRQWTNRVIAYLEQPVGSLDLPLDICGTEFQRRVWGALRQIPVGQTLSYTDLAARIDAPKAVRAVATACSANTLAIAIPCHRAVRKSGQLSGYRWGAPRKRLLLEREGALAN